MIYGERIRAGLVGLPSSGKTTIFNLLTKSSAEVAPYPFTTKDKNHGVMILHDDLIDKIADIMKSSEIRYPALEIVDVAGLVKGAHAGEGLGNEFLSYIRPLDVVVYVLRYLKSVPHIEGEDDIKRDFDILRYEIAMKDLEILSRYEEKLKKPAMSGDKEAKSKLFTIQKLKEAIDEFLKSGNFPIEQDDEIELICSKPYFVIINTDIARDKWNEFFSGLDFRKVIVCDAQMELEFDEDDLITEGITPMRIKMTEAIFDVADIITYYTGFEKKELRGWIGENGMTVYDAAGFIHSDIQKGFISAEVASGKEYANCLNDQDAYKKGLFKTVGRDYNVQDRDIIRIKFR